MQNEDVRTGGGGVNVDSSVDLSYNGGGSVLASQGGDMTQVEILEEFKNLTIPERLTIVEAVLRLIHEDLQQLGQPLTQIERRRQLAAAAEALLPDYAAGGELTIFTALDREGFYA